MPDRQGNYRVSGKGAADDARWRNPRCQWQGGSRADCADAIVSVPVVIKWPLPSVGNVWVCVTHAPTYKVQARKAGVLA